MPEVKWWVKDREKAVKQGKKNNYISTTMEDILLNWDYESAKAGSKFIKVSFGRTAYAEFIFYNMEKFQRALREHNKNEILIYDMYDLVSYSENLGSETVNKMFKKVCNKYKIGKKRHALIDLLNLESINEVLIEIDDFMEKYEEYALMDLF